MKKDFRFLIIDGYPKASRDQFIDCGVSLAGELYALLLLRHMPEAKYDIIYSSDPGTELPGKEELKNWNAIIWPGCNLTVYHTHDEKATKLVKLAKNGYLAGIPQFGSCWAAQLAVYAAGGDVQPNPKGREMGEIGRASCRERVFRTV